MVFIYFSGKTRYSSPRQCIQHRKEVLGLLRNREIPIIDVHSVFTSRSDPLSFFPEGKIVHYKEEGYKLVADRILSYTRAESWVYSCVLKARAHCRYVHTIA